MGQVHWQTEFIYSFKEKNLLNPSYGPHSLLGPDITLIQKARKGPYLHGPSAEGKVKVEVVCSFTAFFVCLARSTDRTSQV